MQIFPNSGNKKQDLYPSYMRKAAQSIDGKPEEGPVDEAFEAIRDLPGLGGIEAPAEEMLETPADVEVKIPGELPVAAVPGAEVPVAEGAEVAAVPATPAEAVEKAQVAVEEAAVAISEAAEAVGVPAAGGATDVVEVEVEGGKPEVEVEPKAEDKAEGPAGEKAEEKEEKAEGKEEKKEEKDGDKPDFLKKESDPKEAMAYCKDKEPKVTEKSEKKEACGSAAKAKVVEADAKPKGCKCAGGCKCKDGVCKCKDGCVCNKPATEAAAIGGFHRMAHLSPQTRKEVYDYWVALGMPEEWCKALTKTEG